jgi:hypothetical protein
MVSSTFRPAVLDAEKVIADAIESAPALHLLSAKGLADIVIRALADARIMLVKEM